MRYNCIKAELFLEQISCQQHLLAAVWDLIISKHGNIMRSKSKFSICRSQRNTQKQMSVAKTSSTCKRK